MRPTNEEIEDLALRLEIDYREHRYQNCQRAASMLRRLMQPEGGAITVPVATLKKWRELLTSSRVITYEDDEDNNYDVINVCDDLDALIDQHKVQKKG
jgi:hypothetical protein